MYSLRYQEHRDRWQFQSRGGPTGNPPETAGAAGITPPNQVSLPPAQLEDLNLIRNEWAKIIRSAGGSARACFRDTVVEPGGEGCLTIVFLDSMRAMIWEGVLR
ncbi:MAG: hypothetical protein ACLVAV_19285 [Clostridium sp.]